MSIRVLLETKEALGGDFIPKNTSRSLRLSRFAAPEFKEDDRKNWFASLVQTKCEAPPSKTDWLPASSKVIYAQLMSRLMINLSGGVMENANLHVDRYGTPVIPGSAVKGCARRMALQALRDWVMSDGSDFQENDVSYASCASFQNQSDMLAQIASVFGWIETDWDYKKKDDLWPSDFAWASNGDTELLNEAKTKAGDHDSFSGTIAFLQATPHRDPGLVLDVVTPHHTAYYQGEEEFSHAPDTEDPIPVYFPAVKEQKSNEFYTFPLIPLSRAQSKELDAAALWLRQGLELLGLGAKTAAGYGWFDTSDEFQSSTIDHLEKTAADLDKKQQNKLDAEAERIAQQKAQQEKELLKKAQADLSPEELADDKIKRLSDQQFDAKVRNFCKKKGAPSDDEKAAIVRSLRKDRLDEWKAFKKKSTKGPLASVEQAIRALNKQLHGDKMP